MHQHVPVSHGEGLWCMPDYFQAATPPVTARLGSGGGGGGGGPVAEEAIPHIPRARQESNYPFSWPTCSKNMDSSWVKYVFKTSNSILRCYIRGQREYIFVGETSN